MTVKETELKKKFEVMQAASTSLIFQKFYFVLSIDF